MLTRLIAMSGSRVKETDGVSSQYKNLYNFLLSFLIMIQDALQVKEKIITFIRLRGPSLPVHIAKETGLSLLFASAFLSDLYSEKVINISNIKIGSSPLYFIPGQEPQLENFSKYLKNKEKEAFIILKEKKFLRDSELQPAIRVALREIKDFAIPFKKDEEIYWRYFTIPEDNLAVPKIENKVEEKAEVVEIKQEQEVIVIEEKKIENIFDDTERQEEEISRVQNDFPSGGREFSRMPESLSAMSGGSSREGLTGEIESPKEEPKKEKPKPKRKRQNNNKRDENFFNKIKEFLEKKNIEILDIKDFRNNEAVLKIKKERKEELLFVFNKKKITEKEILRSHKKASEENIKYSILFMAETPKRLSDLIDAVRNLSEIDKIN